MGILNLNHSNPISVEETYMDGFCSVGRSDNATAVANSVADAFDQHHFHALLYEWIICNNISFKQLDSPQLRRLLSYLTDRSNGLVPSSITVRPTVAILYTNAIGAVTESLHSAITNINFSFDLWTSKNKLALLGLCAHFINNVGEPITTLLAIPR
jgi:hypothetical protein